MNATFKPYSLSKHKAMTLPKIHLTPLWVVTIAILLFLIPLLILEYPLLQYSKGLFIYPQDEAYVRMATAKNLVLHGSWRLWDGEFNSASSSILYPLLLAILYKLFGAHLIFPFLINLLAALAFIMLLHRWLKAQGLSSVGQVSVMAVTILLTPLPVLAVGGMEHMLQVLLTFLFLTNFSAWIADDRRRNLPWSIYLWGAIMTAVRYEGLFLVLIACIVLLLKRRYFLCLPFGIIACLPVIIFGIYSLQHGAYFIPTSIMIKAVPLPLNSEAIRKFFTDDLFTRIVYPFNTYGAIATTRLLIVLPVVYWLFLPRMRENPLYRRILLICLAMTLFHLAFSSAVLFFRYEAYLVACAIIITGVLITKNGKIAWPQKGRAARWIALWSAFFLLYPLFSRAWTAYKTTDTECLNTYEQSFQAAKFVQRYYHHAPVITDYIGVTSYFSEGKKIDLISGIGYTEIARSREGNFYRAEYADFIVQQEKPALAIIPENKYGYPLLQHWKKVADWYTNNISVFRDDHISFYALDSARAPELKRTLQAFEPSLPTAIKVVYP